ncbi:hypothetical protein ACS0TY_024919 [Phlomoides rotata]
MKGIEQVRICENGTIDGQGGLWHAKKHAIPAPHNKPELLVLNIDDFEAKAGGISDNSQIRGTIKSFPQMYNFPKRLWIKFENVMNIDVFGGGTIDGNGQVWWNNSCKIKKTKIAIMGCIVNDPGEMADADFGYIGTLVKRAIAMEQVTDALINLIKEHGRWVDPPTEE